MTCRNYAFLNGPSSRPSAPTARPPWHRTALWAHLRRWRVVSLAAAYIAFVWRPSRTPEIRGAESRRPSADGLQQRNSPLSPRRASRSGDTPRRWMRATPLVRTLVQAALGEPRRSLAWLPTKRTHPANFTVVVAKHRGRCYSRPSNLSELRPSAKVSAIVESQRPLLHRSEQLRTLRPLSPMPSRRSIPAGAAQTLCDAQATD